MDAEPTDDAKAPTLILDPPTKVTLVSHESFQAPAPGNGGRPQPHKIILPVSDEIPKTPFITERPEGTTKETIKVTQPVRKPVGSQPRGTRRLEIIESYDDLFQRQEDEGSIFLYDKYVHLLPFNKRAYIVCATYTDQDFYRYSWLLAQSEERWYTMPTVSELAEMRRSGLRKLDPVEDPKPTGLDTPVILAGEALYLDRFSEESVDRQSWGECRLLHPDEPVTPSLSSSTSDSHSENGSCVRSIWACETCFTKRQQLYNEFGWVYLTVIRAEEQGLRTPQGNGTGMFMLKRFGSREMAAATAFCDAGVRGWSTVFCCAIRGDLQLQGWDGEFEFDSVNIQRVLISQPGVIRVYY